MNRPLLVTDCDEVLLHMVGPFGEWLGVAHDVDFALDHHDFGRALTRRSDGSVLAAEEVWSLLDGFFATEMARQTPVPHAIEALGAIGEVADIVVLTNLKDQCHAGRVAQLAAHGIRHRVVCNQGPKGPPLARLLAEMAPPVAAFVDDLPQHHESVAETTPHVHRLHMVAEPRMAVHVAPAAHAHARIDDWRTAEGWLIERLAGGPRARLTRPPGPRP
ncbi:MAG: HAD family hydrolase [Sphingomonas fennica]